MKKGLSILLTGNASINFAIGMLGPIYALFVEHIGGDILDASGAYAVYMCTAGCITFILGKWEDHYKHKEKFVFIGYLVLTFGFLSYIFVHTQTMLMFTQALLGLGIAIAAPSFDALYAAHTTKRAEASEWAMWESMNSIVLALSALLGGYIVTYYSFDVLFVCMAGLSFTGAVYTLRLFRI